MFQVLGRRSSFKYITPLNCVAVTLIKWIFLWKKNWFLHSKFVSVHPVPIFDLPNDSIGFYQHMLNPTWTFCIARNESLYYILGKLKRVGFLHVHLKNPAWDPVLPLYNNFPTMCHLPPFLFTFLCCGESIFLIDLWYVFFCDQWSLKRSFVCSSNHQLGKNIFCNHIWRKWLFVTIWVFNLMHVYVQDGAITGLSNR